MATRRSPRSIARFCNEFRFESCTAEQTALLLSLAQCTGWSADRICLKMNDITKLEKPFKAEDVWIFHSEWSQSRGGSYSATEEDIDIMKILTNEAGVLLKKIGNPLDRTVQPTTVRFRTIWSPKTDDEGALLDGFTPTTRELSKNWLAQQKQNTRTYAIPTTTEEGIIRRFGNTVALIIKDTLKRWAKTMWVKIKNDPALRPIREREHVMLIMEYLGRYQDAFEVCFGLMEHIEGSEFVNVKDDIVHIQSTGYAAKVLLGLIMADRLHVIERLRRQKRERICFLKVYPESLEQDSRECPVCQDTMGVETPEGANENPLQLVVCCGRYIGESCLKTWLGEFVYPGVLRDNCPICRFVFPEAFMDKLFDGEEDMANGEPKEESEELASLFTPAPSPDRSTIPAEFPIQQILRSPVPGHREINVSDPDLDTVMEESIGNLENVAVDYNTEGDEFMLEG